jgi:hypothetical protein
MILLCKEEGRAASKALIKNLAVFSMSQQAFSSDITDIIPNSAVGLFPQKQKEQRTKQLGY